MKYLGLVRPNCCGVVNAAMVTDGLSNTLAVAEKRLALGSLNQAPADDNYGNTSGFDTDIIRMTSSAPAPDTNTTGTGNDLFGSSHPGVVQGVFADGSVHRLGYGIDPQVFANLGAISDGTVVDFQDIN
ncbi:MAG TPA: DUF1559 domain-containing protein [Gemmataceae bacterium]|jgi:hypothetical protein|nr:DUF1559 domain-containing protein [Gemmataceae bacterium]